MPVCRGHRKAWSCLTGLSAVALCASAVYLFISMNQLVVAINCVVTTLSRVAEAATDVGDSAVSQLPAAAISFMQNFAPYLDFASMGPALLSMVLLLIATALGFGCGRKSNPKSFICAKCVILLAQGALTITLGFYVALTAAALMADRPLLTDQWAAFTAVCDESLPSLQQAVDDATVAIASLADAGPTAGQLSTAQRQLVRLRAARDDFVTLCDCLDQPSIGPWSPGALV